MLKLCGYRRTHETRHHQQCLVNPAISRKGKNKKEIIKETLDGKQAQGALLAVLKSMQADFTDGNVVTDRAVFTKQLSTAFEDAGITLNTKLQTALLAPGGLDERDPAAEICRDKQNNPEPDADLRDSENVPFPATIALPLPLDYESKKTKGKWM